MLKKLLRDDEMINCTEILHIEMVCIVHAANVMTVHRKQVSIRTKVIQYLIIITIIVLIIHTCHIMP